MTTQEPVEDPAGTPGEIPDTEPPPATEPPDDMPSPDGYPVRLRRRGLLPDEPAKPPQDAIGRYKLTTPPITSPTDPISPFIRGRVPRKRRSDWPVFVFALVASSVVMAVCCIAGFALFTRSNPFSP
jgi:hypothetical protein